MTSVLSHRERVRLALEFQETDRVPIAMVCSGINAPARAALTAYLAAERGTTVEAFLAPLIDIKNVGPAYVGPPCAPGFDMWGVHRKAVSYGSGEYNEIDVYPLGSASSVADVNAHTWPSPDWFDDSVLPARVRDLQRHGEYGLMAANANIFETSWYMRGLEQMMMDFVLAPDLAHAILQKVADFYVARLSRILEAVPGEIDLVFTADDLGGQQGLLMSLAMWEAFIKPHHARLNARIHELGAKVIYHSDGAVMEVVPGLIDMGIDVLQALQFDARGMDPVALKQQYGDRLCFEGGISVQSTLPFGSVADVVREVEERIAVLGAGGGYILGPSHAIQAGTPPENIVALFDTAGRFAHGNARIAMVEG
ncbi:MAG: hypothetical protein JXR37_36900 [Kiritimatiellae bacterium]|nr:hypothetical protein [Kiritimatiellia bacterium]